MSDHRIQAKNGKVMAAGKLSSPKVSTYDRFIPYRPHLNVDVAHARVMSPPSGARNCPSPWCDERLLIYSAVLGGILDTPGHKQVLPIFQQSPEATSK